MNLIITGNLRSVANSAWVSTLDESKAAAKSDEEVIRVTKFLVENNHTSPFESVTLTFSFSTSEESEDASYQHWEMAPFLASPYVKSSQSEDGSVAYITTDLFNFIKIAKSAYRNGEYKSTTFWKIFEGQDPLLASTVDGFKAPEPYSGGAPDVSSLIGETGITVELVDVHHAPVREHVRATWRICCPLSIAVQMLRHRTGSWNMTSGRYRTLNQDMVHPYVDIQEIMGKIFDPNLSPNDTAKWCELSFKAKFRNTSESFRDYDWAMKESKKAKEDGKITNDEYKRFREFARYVLPEGRMTELYCTFYLPDFIHYLQLRDSPHAQTEHIYVAQQMKKTLNEKLKEKI
jgi:thymidylate synthase (FAD)